MQLVSGRVNFLFVIFVRERLFGASRRTAVRPRMRNCVWLKRDEFGMSTGKFADVRSRASGAKKCAAFAVVFVNANHSVVV